MDTNMHSNPSYRDYQLLDYTTNYGKKNLTTPKARTAKMPVFGPYQMYKSAVWVPYE